MPNNYVNQHATSAGWMTGLLLVLSISLCTDACAMAQDPEPAVPAAEKPATGEPTETAATPAEAPTVIAEDEQDEDWEVEAAEMGEAIFVGMGIQPAKMQAAKRFQLTQLFAVEIEEINRVCELNKKQALKLRVAAKGAVKKSLEKWEKTSGQQFGIVAPAAANDAAAEAGDGAVAAPVEPEPEITDADQIDEMTMQMVLMGNMGNPFKVEDERNSKFWRKAIAGILNDQQLDKLAAHRDARKLARRKAVITATVSGLELELALSAEQTAKLTELITPKMIEADVNCMAMYEPYVLNYYASKVSDRELKKCLSDSQLQKWKIYMAPSKQIGQMLEMENDFMDGPEIIEVEGNVFESIEETGETLANAIDGLLNMFEK